MKNSIAIIGTGNMGAAIIRRLAAANFTIKIFDINTELAQTIAQTSNNISTATLDEIALEKLPVVLAVKPNHIEEIAAKFADDRLIISIAAGVTLPSIDLARNNSGPTCRVMPNIPLQVQEGITAIIANQKTSKSQLEFCKNLFLLCGQVVILDNEEQMHAVTALSGSGPAFVMSFLQALEDGAVQTGLPRELALKLARQTIIGSVILEKLSEKTASELKDQVTSKGGTTAAGLKALEEEGFEKAVHKAILQASLRSKELGAGA